MLDEKAGLDLEDVKANQKQCFGPGSTSDFQKVMASLGPTVQVSKDVCRPESVYAPADKATSPRDTVNRPSISP